MKTTATVFCLLTMLVLAPRPAAAAEFPEVDLSFRWSTVGAFEPEFDLVADRHYVDRFNPEVGFHVLPFLTVTGEYAFSHMLRRSYLSTGAYDQEMMTHLRTHSAAVGVRVHPNLRGVLLPFARVTVGVSTATMVFDVTQSGIYGYASESDTHPEVTVAGGTEILFPRGVRQRSHEALGGKAGRAVRNGTVGMVLQAGHVFAPPFRFDHFGELAVGRFNFELGFVIHM